jgi:phage shock protein A
MTLVKGLLVLVNTSEKLVKLSGGITMGMFSRMSDIVQANINTILDKAEDPAKIIKLLIQEMEETLVELRSVAARNIADKKQLQRKVDKLQDQASAWQSKATLAMHKEREDLARAALVEKHHAQQQAQALQEELDVVEESLGKLQADTGKLQEKLAEARTKQKSYVVRERSATVRLQVKNQSQVEKIDAAIVKFELYERRIDDLESQVEAYDLVGSAQSLNTQFAEMEAQEQIDRELDALRKKVA